MVSGNRAHLGYNKGMLVPRLHRVTRTTLGKQWLQTACLFYANDLCTYKQQSEVTLTGSKVNRHLTIQSNWLERMLASGLHYTINRVLFKYMYVTIQQSWYTTIYKLNNIAYRRKCEHIYTCTCISLFKSRHDKNIVN